MKKKYSITSALYGRKTSLIESLYMHNHLNESQVSGGMAAQDMIAAYLIDNIPSVVRCVVAAPRTHEPDVKAFDAQGKVVTQVESKDISSTTGGFTGYAEVNKGKTQFRKDLTWIDSVTTATFPPKFATIKGGPSAGLGSLNTKLNTVVSQLVSQSKAQKGFHYCVMYGGESHGNAIYHSSGLRDMYSTCWGGSALTLSQIKAVQGSETLLIRRGGYGYIYGQIVAVAKNGIVSLSKHYAPGKYLGGKDRPYDNLDENWLYSKATDAQKRSFVMNAEGNLTAKDDKKHNAMLNGKSSDTNVKSRNTPASWVPMQSKGPTFDKTMHDHYKNDKDNYFASVSGTTISFYHIFGKDLLSKGSTTFSPVDSSGMDLSKLKLDKVTIGEPFQGKSYAVYFSCISSGKPIVGSPTSAAAHRRSGKIVDS